MFELRFNADKATKQIKQLDAFLRTRRDDVIVPYYFQRLQGIAARAANVGREAIRNAVTETGKRRATGGGQPGRIDSGKFLESFKWEVRAEAKGVYRVRVGFIDNQPDYASYQDLGFIHRSGMVVTGADAIGAAERYAANEIAKLRV